MYEWMNIHIETILQGIDAHKHVEPYVRLIKNLRERAGTSQYQSDYGYYWAMRVLDAEYRKVYFGKLLLALKEPPDLEKLVTDLYDTPANKNGKSLQFSFATKLLHMVDNHSPIYDSLVAAFYSFNVPERSLPLADRVHSFIKFHNWLRGEYVRILEKELLAPSINAFRGLFARSGSAHFTNEKIIDSLIWATAGRKDTPFVADRELAYPKG